MAADSFSGGNTVIIDLGLDRGEPDTYRAPTRPTTPTWFGPTLAAALVLILLGASAAPAPPPLSQLLSLPIGPADAFVAIDDGQLLAQSMGTLNSYDLATGEQRWSAEPTAPTSRLRVGAGLVLLRPWTYATQFTTAVSVTTGKALWRNRAGVVTVDGSDTLLAVANVRTSAGPARRVQGPIEALDPATGAPRWRIDVPSTAVMVGVPGSGDLPTRLLLIRDDRTATMHDLATGAELAKAPMPPADYGPDNPAVSGGLILLRHPSGYGGQISAYDPVTLRERWSIPAGHAFEVTNCGQLACLVGPDGVRAIDPADGTPRWNRPGWRSVEERGDLVLAYGSPIGTAYPIGLVDPATSRILVDLTGWRPVPGTTGSGSLLLTRAADAGSRTLVCRTVAGELVVWAYRNKI
jgi:hypothetical protein